MRRPGLLLALGLLGLILLPACALAEEEPLRAQDVVASIPWKVGEETSYTILDRDDKVLGTGVLRIDQEDGQLRLSQHYQNPDFDDRSSVLVDPETLKPIEGERVITGEDGVLRIEVHYFSGIAEVERIATEEGKEERHTDRLNVPEHAYDTGASLFLWRTIPMQVDYRAAYRSMATALVGKSQENRVTLRVLRQETVEVPAGTFQAWRVEIRAPGGVRQTAWYAADSARRLLKYDNGQNTFLLESVKEG